MENYLFILYETWKLETWKKNFYQSKNFHGKGRLHLKGQCHSVNVWHLVPPVDIMKNTFLFLWLSIIITVILKFYCCYFVICNFFFCYTVFLKEKNVVFIICQKRKKNIISNSLNPTKKTQTIQYHKISFFYSIIPFSPDWDRLWTFEVSGFL